VRTQAARKELDKIDKLIDTEQWDKIRTILNSPPLAFTGPGSISSTMRDARKTLPKNMQGAAKGISEEFLTTTRLLDSFVYSNVFIDEGRKVLGTKTDFKTPKGCVAPGLPPARRPRTRAPLSAR
jgi:hypothetical protein